MHSFFNNQFPKQQPLYSTNPPPFLGLFIANVFATTEGEEPKLCGNQLVSRVLEQLLPKATAAVKERFMTVLGDDLRVTATDAFASHILEKLMYIAAFGEDKDVSRKVTFYFKVLYVFKSSRLFKFN